jgi:glycerol-3-phosphate acyltransferase PlsY
MAAVLASVGAALIVTIRHTDNLIRLHSGTERKLGERTSPV